METTTIPDYPRGITFEQVWAALMEDREALKASKEEFDRRMQETDRRMQETDRRMQETDRCIQETARQIKETDRIVKRNGKQMGGLHHRFGELAEHLVAPGIAKRFNELGFHFESISPGGQKILDEQGKTLTEIDLLLENGNYIVAVEVKTRPVEKDVAHHVRRLEILREFRNKRRDERKIQGAIAGAVFPAEVKQAAIEAGLYVLEQSGDTMQIDLPGGFVPREW